MIAAVPAFAIGALAFLNVYAGLAFAAIFVPFSAWYWRPGGRGRRRLADWEYLASLDNKGPDWAPPPRP